MATGKGLFQTDRKYCKARTSERHLQAVSESSNGQRRRAAQLVYIDKATSFVQVAQPIPKYQHVAESEKIAIADVKWVL